MFNALVSILEHHHIIKLASLKYIFLAGEALLPALIKNFNIFKTAIQLENLYGPTEGTVYASRYSLADWQDTGSSIPIGQPMPNVTLYILNKDNHLQPLGVSGELCIGGAGVARGYVNRPQLTCERFISLPFLSERTIYKTGDIARWLPNGQIEFLGRIDHQVKIRGFRIELGEIENRLRTYPGIKDVVVIANKRQNQEYYLIAYLVAPHDISQKQVRLYLQAYLPDYMIPAYFVTLDQLPLTPTGKIDRKQLPAVSSVADSKTEYVAPVNDMERKITAIWSELLAIEKDKISTNANFFALGGHSLLIITLFSRLKQTFDVEIPVTQIYDNPTIKKIAHSITTNSYVDQAVSLLNQEHCEKPHA